MTIGKKRAVFVTFEGMEGVGKSTQIHAVRHSFESRGLSLFSTREPGGSPLSDSIRGVLLKSSDFSIDPIAELLLIVAARRQHVADVLIQALQTYDIVLCDRFTDSTVAYQGGGRQIDRAWISELNERVTQGVKPDLTILLDMPADKAIERALGRISGVPKESAEDRFEKESLAFHKRIREAYLDISKKEPGRFLVLDATSEEAQISKMIIQRLETLLKSKR